MKDYHKWHAVGHRWVVVCLALLAVPLLCCWTSLAASFSDHSQSSGSAADPLGELGEDSDLNQTPIFVFGDCEISLVAGEGVPQDGLRCKCGSDLTTVVEDRVGCCCCCCCVGRN